MDGIKESLESMVRAGMAVQRMQDAFCILNKRNEMLDKIFDHIVDSIIYLTRDDSGATHTALTAPILTVERRVEILYAEWEKHNRTEPMRYAMPRPVTISKEDMKRMVEQFGGYMFEEKG